jgi:hypothetical protein
METDNLKSERARIAKLGDGKPSESARGELESAIQSKWQGVQVAAARALLSWGDARSVSAVKTLLSEHSKTRQSFSSVSTLAFALAPHLQASDLKWVLRLYFHESNPHNRSHLTSLFRALPAKETAAALERCLDAKGYDAKEVRLAIHSLASSQQTALPNKALQRTRSKQRASER